MKWLILFLSGILIANLAFAMEHSAVSNIFTLDTREEIWVAMFHSAVSNIFTLDTRDAPIAGGLSHSAVSKIFALDTRDAVIMLKLVNLSPDPNPQLSQVMEGGTAYRYYRVIDGNGKSVPGVKPVLQIAPQGASLYTITGEPSYDYGLVKLPVSTKGIAKPGDTLTAKVIKIGDWTLPASDQITFQVKVIPRDYVKYWDDGTKIGGKMGLSVVGHGYIKGQSEAGMSVGIARDDQIVMSRRISGAAGVGAGIETPGAKFNIGSVGRGKLGASASAELLVTTLKEDEYLFNNPQQSGQKMAQAALLLHHITTLGGRLDPFVVEMIKVLVGITNQTYYSNYRTYEMAGLGIDASAEASAELDLGFGFGTADKPDNLGFGINIESGLGTELSASAQYIRYYQGQTVTGTGLGLDQYVEFEVTPLSIMAQVVFAGKEETDGKFGQWEPLKSFKKAARFTEELMWNNSGELIRITVAISDEERIQTYIIEGKENIEATKSAAKNLMNMILALSNPVATVIVGPKQIQQELKSLLTNAAKVQVNYEILKTPTKTQKFPFSLEGSLGVKAGFEAELSLAQHVDAISERGTVIRGWEFPMDSYDAHPESDRSYTTIVNNALSGSWEIIKDKFQQVVKTVQAGTQAVVEVAAATVKSTVKLVGKFKESGSVVLRIWTPSSSPFPFQAPASPQYVQALQQATAPIIGAYYQFTPEGAVLAEPGTLQISYSDDEIAKYGVNESSLRISYWDVKNSRWVSVGGIVDRNNNTVTASIKELHLFAITFDETPPGIGQLLPVPDSVITGPDALIQASIADDTNQLDASSVVMLLDNKKVPYVFDGKLISYFATNLFVGKHTVTVKAGDMYGNMAERTWPFILRNPKAVKWDVNGDGVVDVQDMILVGNTFGILGKGLAADVNDDGLVDILDLVIVASHFGEKTGLQAGSLWYVNGLDADRVIGWLKAARLADDGSEEFRRGIGVLENLLKSLVPEKSALLQNYPNPFNPDTWIPYQLKEESDVFILIYDVNGVIIRRLDLGRKAAGIYRTQSNAAYWDGRNDAGEAVSSGVYFVALKAGKFEQMRRMVLIK